MLDLLGLFGPTGVPKGDMSKETALWFADAIQSQIAKHRREHIEEA
jgi:hypothetical protein